jgi:hypothetical protein
VLDPKVENWKSPCALSKGADDAVLGGSAGINRKRKAGTRSEVVHKPVALTEVARPGGLIVDAAVERGVDAQVTAELDAGVGAGDVPESSTIQGADPHVFDRFGLHGKISRLCPTHGDQGRR